MISQDDQCDSPTGYNICTSEFYSKVLQDLMLEIFAGGLQDCEIYLASAMFRKDLGAVKNYSMLVGRPETSSFFNFFYPSSIFGKTLQCMLMTLCFTNSYMWVEKQETGQFG